MEGERDRERERGGGGAERGGEEEVPGDGLGGVLRWSLGVPYPLLAAPFRRGARLLLTRLE
jgi:hypothetical protein